MANIRIEHLKEPDGKALNPIPPRRIQRLRNYTPLVWETGNGMPIDIKVEVKEIPKVTNKSKCVIL